MLYGQSARGAQGDDAGKKSHFNLDTQDTLAEQDVADSVVDKVASRLTRVDHEAVGEFHGLGTSSAQLARDDDFATLGARLHNEAEDTIASTFIEN